MHFEVCFNQVWHLHAFVCFAAFEKHLYLLAFGAVLKISFSEFYIFQEFQNLDFWRKFGASIFELGPLILYGAGAGGEFPESPVVLPSFVLHV